MLQLNHTDQHIRPHRLVTWRGRGLGVGWVRVGERKPGAAAHAHPPPRAAPGLPLGAAYRAVLASLIPSLASTGKHR